jgi:predicted Ser/Thr protein kinase
MYLMVQDLENIATGGHGKIFKLKNENTVIKIAIEENVNLLKEGKILESLQSMEYFPKLYFYNKDLIVMEYIQGTHLNKWLSDGNKITNNILSQIIDAFTLCLRNGVMPVELEPDHVIVADNRVKIIDVGMYLKSDVVVNGNQLILNEMVRDFTTHFISWVDFWSKKKSFKA